jgi:hypothetical protein
MPFGSLKLKPESGANQIKSADYAYSFVAHMRLSYQNKPHWQVARQALNHAGASDLNEIQAWRAFRVAVEAVGLARRIGLILAPSRAGVDHPGSRLERIIRKKRPPQPGGATAKVGGRTPGREKPEGRPAKAIIFHARSGPAAALRIRFPRWPGKG